MNSKAQSKSDTKKPTDRRILEQAEREERGEPVACEDYAAWQAKQTAIDEAEATGSPEVVALRKLARAAESIFEFRGNLRRPPPAEILREALRCAQSDFAVLGDASSTGSGMADNMTFRRAELRIDLALALAEYREEFPMFAPEAEAAE